MIRTGFKKFHLSRGVRTVSGMPFGVTNGWVWLAASVAMPGVAFAAPPTAQGSAVVNEISVVGTIRGGNSPTLRDTAVLLDTVSQKTLVLAVGQCLPRLPTVCVHAIHDKTVELSTSREVIEVSRLDGALPPASDGYEGGSGKVLSAPGSDFEDFEHFESDGNGMEPEFNTEMYEQDPRLSTHEGQLDERHKNPTSGPLKLGDQEPWIFE